MPVDPLSAPGKYKIENKYGVHGLIISRYGTNRTTANLNILLCLRLLCQTLPDVRPEYDALV